MLIIKNLKLSPPPLIMHAYPWRLIGNLLPKILCLFVCLTFASILSRLDLSRFACSSGFNSEFLMTSTWVSNRRVSVLTSIANLPVLGSCLFYTPYLKRITMRTCCYCWRCCNLILNLLLLRFVLIFLSPYLSSFLPSFLDFHSTLLTSIWNWSNNNHQQLVNS